MSKCPVKVGRGLHASRKLSTKVCLAAALIIAVLAASCFVLFSDTDDSSADPPATNGSCGTNATWSYADGTLTISGTGTMSDYNARSAPWYPLNQEITTVVIESGITSIGKYAFFDLPNLTSVTIPEGVMLIEYESFYNCKSLATLTLPDSLVTIKEYAFQNCSSLTSVTIPDNVEVLTYGVFSLCSSLQTIDLGSIVSMQGNAIEGTAITVLNIPDSMTGLSVSDRPFGKDSRLTAVNVGPDNGNLSSEDGVLFNKDKTALIFYPSAKSGTSYTIPASVTSIRNGAFADNASLQSVTLPDSLVLIYRNAFAECTSLSSIEFPDTLQQIYEGAFRECTSLSSLEIPSSVTNIDDYAFFGCTALTTVQIHGLVRGEGQGVFKGCSSLTSITVDADPGASTDYWYTTEDGVLFRFYNDVRTLIAYPAGKTADSYSVPDGISAIGNGALAHNSHLKSLSIPDSVTSIDDHAFDESVGLESVTVSPNNGSFASKDGVLYNKGKTQILLYPVGKTDTTFVIPDGVTAVSGMGLYSACLTSITVPDSFTSPRFYYCPNLVAVNGNATNPTYSFADGCVYLTETGNIYHIPVGITSYTVPSTVTAFNGEEIIGEKMAEVRFVSGTTLNVSMTGFFLIRSNLTLIIEDGANITFGQYAIVFESAEGATLTAVVPKGFAFPEDSVVFIGANETIFPATIKYIDSSLEPSEGKIDVESDTDSEELSADSIAFIKEQAEEDQNLVMDITLSGGITASFDNKAIKSLGSGAATLTVTKVAATDLDQAVKDLVGDNPVFEISFGNNTNFGEGKATFTVPYVLPEGKSASDLKVYCIKDGKVAETIDCTYADGKATFSTGHLSTYSVGFIDTGNGGGTEFPIWIVAAIAVVAIAGIGGAVFLKKRKA